MSIDGIADRECWICDDKVGPFTVFEPIAYWTWRGNAVRHLAVLCPLCAKRRELARLRDSATTRGVRALADALVEHDRTQLRLFGGRG